MNKALTRTDFNFEGQKSVYHGKVRDVYNINDKLIILKDKRVFITVRSVTCTTSTTS